MKLKIRDEEEEEDPQCEFWLEKHEDELKLKSKRGDEFPLCEFRIKPDGSWYKVRNGNLKNIEKR